MYQCNIEPFGSFKRYTIFSKKCQHSMSIVPACGANLLSIQLNGKSLLDGYATPDELTANAWSKSIVLFPFPNRLKDGRYSFEGQDYHFPLNNISTANAIHGFGKMVEMEVKSLKLEEEHAVLRCEYSESGDRASYPFAHRFSICFELSDAGGLWVRMGFKNEGLGNLPVGLGWHPYFQLDCPVEDLTLTLPPCRMVEIDEGMIPTGERSSYEVFKSPHKIGEVVLDNCFALEMGNGDIAEVSIETADGELRYWQEAGPARFDYLQVFTPPARHAIALEPMSCNVDAFNNGEGLAILEPGAELGGEFGFNFIPKP